MAISAEKLNIILAARDKEFTKAMERSQKRVEMFAKKSQSGLSKTSKSFNDLAGVAKRIAPALAAAFSVRAFQNALSGAAEIENLSNLAGVASDRFQVLALTTQQFGIGQEKLADILKDVNDKFGDYVQTGAGPLADFFEQIAPKVGLTAAAFADLSSEQKLGAYINALKEANVSQADMTFYMEAIASDSTALVRAFENNSAAIKDMEKKAAELGLVIDSETIEKSKEAKKELDLMAKVMDVQVTQALLAVAPLAVQAASAISQITAEIANFLTAGSRLSALANVPLLDAEGLRGLAKEYSGLGKELSAVGQAQAAYTQNLEKYGAGSAEAEGWLKDLTEAENNLRVAIAKKQAQQEAEGAAVSGIQSLAASTKELQEQARLQSMTAEAAERERISRQRAAYEASIIKNINASGQDATREQLTSVLDLGDAWEAAAIKASKILNPVKKAASGAKRVVAETKEIKEQAESAKDEYKLLLEEMIKASPALQQLGFDVEKLESVASVMERSMEGAFMGMVDGTMSVKDAFKSMASDVIKELYRVLVVQQLVGSVKSGTGIAGFVGGLFTGGKASGGPVQAGQPYVTGEHGRELFVPSQSGRVLSVAQSKDAIGGGSGGGVTVIQNNTFGSGVTRAEVNAMLPKMVEATKAAVADAKLRGGSYGGAFS